MVQKQSVVTFSKRRPTLSFQFLLIFAGLIGTMHTATMAAVYVENLVEGFEGSWNQAPQNWSREFVTGSTDWVRANAGLDGQFPSAPHPGSGSYFARFSFEDSETAQTTLLISPAINFTGYYDATLTFWHTQAEYAGDQDNLRIMYRTSSSSSWVQLATYDNQNIPTWTQRTVTLPNLSSDYYVAFEGTAKYGYGVCIDDVVVSSYSPIPEPSGIFAFSLGLGTFIWIRYLKRTQTEAQS